ncbi:addiction module protein [Polymorphobacter glacialis]|uniref:Putative mRNA interferase YoeB n=1 Tax=Sandarakinorhabdus glacialis TaxID=1614636 RepID=A0A916ZWH0_9SPHN|nr:Txe/YoeB family addiction module toxin [Polymorphobacter glacialis]GGE16300.1 addiction module protein [Polymorphobacter glacialis]
MNLQFTAAAWEDYEHWQQQDRAMTARITTLLSDIMRDPFRGIGKPEPLKGELSGWWSRRITSEHRLVYRCKGTGADQRIEVVQCRDHY